MTPFGVADGPDGRRVRLGEGPPRDGRIGLALRTVSMASGWLELEPLKRKPFLRTEEGDEILAVLKGVCRVRVVLDERTAEKYVVRGGDVFLVPKMCFYEVKNTSTEEVAVLLFVVGVGETMVPQRR